MGSQRERSQEFNIDPGGDCQEATILGVGALAALGSDPFLTSCKHLPLPLDAGLFVIFPFFDFGENPRLFALFLKLFQRLVDGISVVYFHSGHVYIFPPHRAKQEKTLNARKAIPYLL